MYTENFRVPPLGYKETEQMITKFILSKEVSKRKCAIVGAGENCEEVRDKNRGSSLQNYDI